MLNMREKSALKKKKTSIWTWLVLLLFVAWFFGQTTPQDKSTDSKTEQEKLSHVNKWTNMLEHALLKNKSNVAVDCKQKKTEDKEYILCEYSLFEIFGKRMTALFLIEGEHIYAVNGTARRKSLLKYNEISEYDVNTMGIVSVPVIINSFK